jgi:pimeloyl-ACP methyl ester carboxylesterase
MRLAYDDVGPGPVVVLLHGFPFNRSMWSAQLTGIGSIYRVIAPDLRGFGDTPVPEGESIYAMEEMADDVVELLDELNLPERVVLGGLSMGGYVALAAMAKYADRFRALLLIDTRAAADTPEAARNREALARVVEETGDVGQVVEGLVPRLFSPLTRERRPEFITPLVESMTKTSPLAVAAALRGMAARPDRTKELPGIKVPTLVVVGADDVICTPDEGRSMAAAIPKARIEVISDAGHVTPVENPGVFNATVLEFLNNLG